jgi:hypothetical protein
MLTTPHPIALFKPSWAFKIAGNRNALIGKILEGIIAPGNYIQLKDCSYRIKSVEAVDSLSRAQFETGLILDINSADFDIALEGVLGQTIIITTLPKPL